VELLEAIILSVLAASTPLLIAATGELVTERSGVLNLGVEGMMIVGAACGFGGALYTGSITVGALCGIVAGTLLALIFALMTLGLAVNQVATGLALTILGIGLSGLIGAGFVGERITPAPHLRIPGLTDLPYFGRILFGEDAFVYVSLFLIVGIWWFLYRTRAGLVLRACGDNHLSAHALGYPVLRIRLFAVMFGGACAGLAGAYLPLAYTPFFIPGMTAGRGWIALALVVFSSWRPGRLVVGAGRPRRAPIRDPTDGFRRPERSSSARASGLQAVLAEPKPGRPHTWRFDRGFALMRQEEEGRRRSVVEETASISEKAPDSLPTDSPFSLTAGVMWGGFWDVGDTVDNLCGAEGVPGDGCAIEWDHRRLR